MLRRSVKYPNTVIRVCDTELNYSVEDIKGDRRVCGTWWDMDYMHLLPYHSFSETSMVCWGQDYTMKQEIKLARRIWRNEGQWWRVMVFQCIIGG